MHWQFEEEIRVYEEALRGGYQPSEFVDALVSNLDERRVLEQHIIIFVLAYQRVFPHCSIREVVEEITVLIYDKDEALIDYLFGKASTTH